MITSFKFDNCFAFNKPVEMSLKADMRTKKFSSNVIPLNEKLNILKSIAIYGPNNTGKTSFIKCISVLKRTLENKPINLSANIFTGNSISTEAVSFIYNEKEYNYEYKFDCSNRSYVYEKNPSCSIVNVMMGEGKIERYTGTIVTFMTNLPHVAEEKGE